MKIFVCVKHVPDTAATIRLSGETAYETADTTFIANPYDEYGVEEAVRLAEKSGGEVVLLSVGPPEAAGTLRACLAMGASRAILITTENQFLDPITTAKALQAVMEKDGKADLIFTGRGAIDTESSQTHYRLAQYLGLPVVSGVCHCSIENEKVTVEREIGRGDRQILEATMPCVIGATKGLNEPRYPKFPDIMKAKKKEITEHALTDFELSPSEDRCILEKIESAPERSGAKLLQGSLEEQVDSLLKILKDEEKVL